MTLPLVPTATLKRRVPTGEEVMLVGVRFDRWSRAEAHAALSGAFGRGEAWKIYIVNAHTLNLAWTIPSFRSLLNKADVLLNDGTGVQIASWMAHRSFPDNLVGTDLVPELCERAASSKVGVFLLGGLVGVAERAAERLQVIVPNLRICGTQHGYFTTTENEQIIERINRSGAGMLLVAFGNPLQEIWIHENASRLRCDLCIGVGGLFDHLSGRLHRAPYWMRRAGIEWLHILLSQPHKWRRYLIGNPLFLLRVISDRIGLGP